MLVTLPATNLEAISIPGTFRLSAQITLGRLFSTRVATDSFRISTFISWDMDFFIARGLTAELLPDTVSRDFRIPEALFLSVTNGVTNTFDRTFYFPDRCFVPRLDASGFDLIRDCSTALCQENRTAEFTPWQIGLRLKGNGLECRPF